MRALTAAETIVEQASSRFKDTREWAFKHALTREAGHQSRARFRQEFGHCSDSAGWIASASAPVGEVVARAERFGMVRAEDANGIG